MNKIFFNNINTLFVNLSSATIVVLVNQISVLIALPFLAYNLGFGGFGILVQSLVIYQIGFIFMEFGFNYSSIFFIKKRDNNISLENIIFPIFIIKFFIFIIIILLASIINFIFTITNLSLFFFSLVMISILMSGLCPVWIYQVKEKNHLLLFATIIARLIFLLLIFLLIQESKDSQLYFLSLSICFLIINILSVYYFRNIKINFKKFRYIFIIIPVTFRFFISSLINFNLNSIWSFALLILGSPAQLVFYNLADQCYRALNMLTGVIPNNLYAKFSNRNNIKISFIISSIICIFFILSYILIYFFIDQIIIIFFDKSYYESIFLIKFYIITSLLFSIISLFSYPVLGLLTSPKKVQNLFFISGFINICALIFWIFFSEKTALSIIIIHTIINSSVLIIEIFWIIKCYYFNLKKLNNNIG